MYRVKTKSNNFEMEQAQTSRIKRLAEESYFAGLVFSPTFSVAFAFKYLRLLSPETILANGVTVFQLIINGNKFVTFNRTNRLITAVISDPLHSLQFLHLILIFRLQSNNCRLVIFDAQPRVIR